MDILKRFLMVSVVGVIIALAGCGKDEELREDEGREDVVKKDSVAVVDTTGRDSVAVDSTKKEDVLVGRIFADDFEHPTAESEIASHSLLEMVSFEANGVVVRYYYECDYYYDCKFTSDYKRGTYTCKNGEVVVTIDGVSENLGKLEKDDYWGGWSLSKYGEVDMSAEELIDEFYDSNSKYIGSKRVYRNFDVKQVYDVMTEYYTPMVRILNPTLGVDAEVVCTYYPSFKPYYLVKRISPLNSYGDWRDVLEVVDDEKVAVFNASNVVCVVERVVDIEEGEYKSMISFVSPTEYEYLRDAGASETMIAVAEGSK